MHLVVEVAITFLGYYYARCGIHEVSLAIEIEIPSLDKEL
jgi:hypothetical protein